MQTDTTVFSLIPYSGGLCVKSLFYNPLKHIDGRVPSNRDQIVSCLKASRDDCEESDLVLSAIGLDLDLMADGFTVLCNATSGNITTGHLMT